MEGVKVLHSRLSFHKSRGLPYKKSQSNHKESLFVFRTGIQFMENQLRCWYWRRGSSKRCKENSYLVLHHPIISGRRDEVLHFSFRRSPSERSGQTLCVRFPMLGPYLDAERRGLHSHAERGNEHSSWRINYGARTDDELRRNVARRIPILSCTIR